MSEIVEDRKRLKPLPATLRELYIHSGNLCAFEPCSSALLLADGSLNFEIAHIHGVEKLAARGNHNLSNEELRDKSNLVLLCKEHHGVVDNKANEENYPVSVVQKMKFDHEAKYRQAMANLDRMIDTSLDINPQLPKNLYGAKELIGFDENHKVILDAVRDMEQFVANLAKQPLAIRDLILFILVHGEELTSLSNSRPAPIATTSTKIVGSANISEKELFRRADHLENAGLISIREDDPKVYYLLENSGPESGGWNIFNALAQIAKSDRKILNERLSSWILPCLRIHITDKNRNFLLIARP